MTLSQLISHKGSSTADIPLFLSFSPKQQRKSKFQAYCSEDGKMTHGQTYMSRTANTNACNKQAKESLKDNMSPLGRSWWQCMWRYWSRSKSMRHYYMSIWIACWLLYFAQNNDSRKNENFKQAKLSQSVVIAHLMSNRKWEKQPKST